MSNTYRKSSDRQGTIEGVFPPSGHLHAASAYEQVDAAVFTLVNLFAKQAAQELACR